MKTILVLVLSAFVFVASAAFATTESTASLEGKSLESKSLEGYGRMDMTQFKDLSRAASQSGSKFKAQCTTRTGEIITSTDSRFTDCMSQQVLEMRQRRTSDQKSVPGQQPASSVGFSTDL